MDKYHCTWKIRRFDDGKYDWVLIDHVGRCVVESSCGYENWHNAKRAMDRHIELVQSGNFTLPEKPLRKEYTFKNKPAKSS